MKFTEPVFIDWLLGHHAAPEPILEVGAGWTPETNQAPFRSHGYTQFLTQDMAAYPGQPSPDFVCDVCEIPQSADSVGTILCFNVLEHCYAPWRAIPECARLLVDGGWFIGSVPGRAAIHRHSRDYWRFMPDGIAELLRTLRLQYFVVDGNPEMPANLLFAAVKDTRQTDWLAHNEAITSQPLLITDTDYYTETQWKRWVVRMARRMGYDIGLWTRHDDRERMNSLGYTKWTIVPQGQFWSEGHERSPGDFGTCRQPRVMKRLSKLVACLAAAGWLSNTGSLHAQPRQTAAAALSHVADVRAFGAAGDGVADDTAAIQSAITSLRASGGQVWIPQGTYRLTKSLVVSMATPTTSLWIQGAGNGATKLVQSTATADVFEIGATGADRANQISLADLWLFGGRYGLNLNNSLVGTFDRLLIQNTQVGIYLQGTNERHTFRNIQIDGSAMHGIYAGATNGGTGNVLDLPELQKTSFDTVRVSGTVGGTAIVITAGMLGNQQVSGHNRLRRILLESNKRGSLQIDYAFATVVEGFSTEEQLDADNVYSSVLVDHQSSVTFRDLLIGKASGRANFAYYVNINSGNATIEDSIVSGGAPAGTADIRVNNTLTLINSFIANASAIQFTGDVQRQTSVAIAVRDTSGRLLTWSGLGLSSPPPKSDTPAER